MSYPNYRFSVDTEVISGSLRILSAPVKNCISGSGGNCLPVPCRVCVRDSVDITFGGVLSGIGVITLPVISSGGDNPYYEAQTPFLGISTSCGTLDIYFSINVGGTGYLIQVRLNGDVIFFRAGEPAICGTFIPGMPESFTYPLDNDSDGAGNFGPNFTLSGNENGCNGEASIVVTNTSSGGDISGSAGDYIIGIDTHVKSESKRVIAGVNCGQISGGASPAMYRAARDTGITVGGKRVLVAEKDPCCDGGPIIIPSGQVVSECCAISTVPKYVAITFGGTFAFLGTQILTHPEPLGLAVYHGWYKNHTDSPPFPDDPNRPDPCKEISYVNLICTGRAAAGEDPYADDYIYELQIGIGRTGVIGSAIILYSDFSGGSGGNYRCNDFSGFIESGTFTGAGFNPCLHGDITWQVRWGNRS